MDPETRSPGYDTTGLSFEEALAQLEYVVERLETGTLSLDASLREYEKGVALSRHCALYLREAEARIEVLSRNATGDEELQPFRLVGFVVLLIFFHRRSGVVAGCWRV
jgi:exodeoxyribonuclease VII small subunit